jgi:hypothetical protein
MPLSRNEVFAFLNQTKKSSVWIGLGVWMIMFGVSAMLLIEKLQLTEGNNTFKAMGMFVLLFSIAIAVAIFIMNGMHMQRYESYTKVKLRLDPVTYNELEQLSERYMPGFFARIAVGVATILIAAGAYTAFDSVFNFINQNMPVAILVFLIGFAVFLFITAGMSKAAFDVLLEKGDYQNKEKNNKAHKIIATAASVYWPLMVAVYFIWSFLGDSWNNSWVIWPVAGILFGALAGGISVWYGDKAK